MWGLGGAARGGAAPGGVARGGMAGGGSVRGGLAGGVRAGLGEKAGQLGPVPGRRDPLDNRPGQGVVAVRRAVHVNGRLSGPLREAIPQRADVTAVQGAGRLAGAPLGEVVEGVLGRDRPGDGEPLGRRRVVHHTVEHHGPDPVREHLRVRQAEQRSVGVADPVDLLFAQRDPDRFDVGGHAAAVEVVEQVAGAGRAVAQPRAPRGHLPVELRAAARPGTPRFMRPAVQVGRPGYAARVESDQVEVLPDG